MSETQASRNVPETVSAPHGGDGLPSLFARNRAWANYKTLVDPSFFSRLIGQQHPSYFWIGCSDSRVPATEIVNLDPGEMFVHRNVANLAMESDPNFAAALQFAIEVLHVEHVIVVGHYGCGGIQAAMIPATNDAIGNWLAPVRALHHDHPCMAVSNQPDPDALCERNVVAQVQALATNPLVHAAWDAQAKLTLHGWIYSISDGLLRTVCEAVHGRLSTPPPFVDGVDAP
ncbi:putative carbonic anhydrase [Caenibius tardaugens NBRC 16725]|uniref:Carbonic anhydrase n=1 Tax=Caenibius tardaugens NBRC 16725 TaxID=1219035 RepID=U2YQD4_9SPHN|nr:carbonic anhydrase [Caenibius tardaugens]AZI36340.1 carbonic anhydrase [Caenibius tardaugens NBRC 16725]GAD50862.1 putative carbonic anhydrase [Caenibius tardaugens NBRC 16725]